MNIVYALAGRYAPYGNSTTAFLVAGIVPFICFFVRVQAAASTAVAGNLSLLYFRQLTPLLLILANSLVEYLTGLVALVIIIGGLFLYQGSPQLSDPLTMLIALTCISILGMAAGTLFGWNVTRALIFVRGDNPVPAPRRADTLIVGTDTRPCPPSTTR